MPFISPDDSSVIRFVRACKAAKERNLVDELLDPFRLLVASGKAPADVAEAVRLFQVRPIYSAQELAYFWPLVCIGLAGKQKAWRPDAAWLHKRLVQCKLPRLRDWNGGYLYERHGAYREYFLVQHINKMRRQRYSQADFERIMEDG